MLLVSFFMVLGLWTHGIVATSTRKRADVVYNFSDIHSSPELIWTPCWDNFTCASLEVPLDYENSSVGTASIAFLKKASTDPRAEDLLINPGGPGQSGVDLILRVGDELTQMLGTQYNLVGFDPRSVNNSRGISLECFPGNANGRLSFDQNVLDYPVDDSSRAPLYEAWQLSRGFGIRCTQTQDRNMTKRYANTVANAQDLMRYITKRAESRGQSASQAKLFYYGGSAGTNLGQTFATLFPDKVGRMILDGVVDPDDYYAGRWESNLWDTDAAVCTFFAHCYEAGSQSCAFYGNATSPEAIEQRFLAIWNDLKLNPILVADPSISSMPVLVKWQDLMVYLTGALYDPLNAFPKLAAIMSELEVRNGTGLALASGRALEGQPIEPSYHEYLEKYERTQIACMDANGRFNLSDFDEYERHVRFLVDQSFYAGNYWASFVGGPCQALDIFPPPSQLFNVSAGADDTYAPILFVGNTYDPVTPLRSAIKMSGRFPGSAVLTVNGTAHTSFSAPSKCAWSYMQAYLADMTLPPVGALCQVDHLPFHVASSPF